MDQTHSWAAPSGGYIYIYIYLCMCSNYFLRLYCFLDVFLGCRRLTACVVLYLFYGQQNYGNNGVCFLGWFLGMTFVCFYILMLHHTSLYGKIVSETNVFMKQELDM